MSSVAKISRVSGRLFLVSIFFLGSLQLFASDLELPSGYTECATGDDSGETSITPIYGKPIETSNLPPGLDSQSVLEGFRVWGYGRLRVDTPPEIVGVLEYDMASGKAYLITVHDEVHGDKMNLFARWCGGSNSSKEFRPCSSIDWWDASFAVVGNHHDLYLVKDSFQPGQAEFRPFLGGDLEYPSDLEFCAFRGVWVRSDGSVGHQLVSYELIRSKEQRGE